MTISDIKRQNENYLLDIIRFINFNEKDKSIFLKFNSEINRFHVKMSKLKNEFIKEKKKK